MGLSQQGQQGQQPQQPQQPPTPTDSKSQGSIPEDLSMDTPSYGTTTYACSSDSCSISDANSTTSSSHLSEEVPEASCCNVPPPPPSACSYPPLLPPQIGQAKKTLVLDLDRTLIDCIMLRDPSISEPDFVYTDCLGVQAKVWTRPFLRQFLKSVSKDFEVVLFTAAGARHADAVLRNIDPQGTLFHYRLYGEHTVEAPMWGWVKDLSRLGRPLTHTLLVDDSMLAALNQPCNLVPIRPFDQARKDKDRDTALPELLRFLQDKVLPAQDVREAIANHWDKVTRRVRRRPLPIPMPIAAAAGACSACSCSCHAAHTAGGTTTLYMQQQQHQAAPGSHLCRAAAFGCGCGHGPGGTAMLAHAYQDWQALEAAGEEEDEIIQMEEASGLSSAPSLSTTTCSCCSSVPSSVASGTPSGLDALMAGPKGLHRSPALSQLYGEAVAAGDLQEALNNMAAGAGKAARSSPGKHAPRTLLEVAEWSTPPPSPQCTDMIRKGGSSAEAVAPSRASLEEPSSADIFVTDAVESCGGEDVANNGQACWYAGRARSACGVGGAKDALDGFVPQPLSDMSRHSMSSVEKTVRGKKNRQPAVASLLMSCANSREAAQVCHGVF